MADQTRIYLPYYNPSTNFNKVKYSNEFNHNGSMIVTDFDNGFRELNAGDIFVNDYVYSTNVQKTTYITALTTDNKNTAYLSSVIGDNGANTTTIGQTTIANLEYDLIFGLTTADPSVLDYNYYKGVSNNVFGGGTAVSNREMTRIGPKLFLYKNTGGNDYAVGNMTATVPDGTTVQSVTGDDYLGSPLGLVGSTVTGLNGNELYVERTTPLSNVNQLWPYKVQHKDTQYYQLLTNGQKQALLALPQVNVNKTKQYLLTTNQNANLEAEYSYTDLGDLLTNNYHYIVSYFDTRPTEKGTPTDFPSACSSIFNENAVQILPLTAFTGTISEAVRHQAISSCIASINPVSYTTTPATPFPYCLEEALDGINPIALEWGKNITITTELNYTCANMVNLSNILTGWNYLPQNMNKNNEYITRANLPYVNIGLMLYVPNNACNNYYNGIIRSLKVFNGDSNYSGNMISGSYASPYYAKKLNAVSYGFDTMHPYNETEFNVKDNRFYRYNTEWVINIGGKQIYLDPPTSSDGKKLFYTQGRKNGNAIPDPVAYAYTTENNKTKSVDVNGLFYNITWRPYCVIEKRNDNHFSGETSIEGTNWNVGIRGIENTLSDINSIAVLQNSYAVSFADGFNEFANTWTKWLEVNFIGSISKQVTVTTGNNTSDGNSVDVTVTIGDIDYTAKAIINTTSGKANFIIPANNFIYYFEQTSSGIQNPNTTQVKEYTCTLKYQTGPEAYENAYNSTTKSIDYFTVYTVNNAGKYLFTLNTQIITKIIDSFDTTNDSNIIENCQTFYRINNRSGDTINLNGNLFTKLKNWLKKFGYGTFWTDDPINISDGTYENPSPSASGVANLVKDTIMNINDNKGSITSWTSSMQLSDTENPYHYSTPACINFNIPTTDNTVLPYEDHLFTVSGTNISLNEDYNFLGNKYEAGTLSINEFGDIVKLVTVFSVPVENAVNTTHNAVDTMTFRFEKPTFSDNSTPGEYYYIIGLCMYITKGLDVETTIANPHYLGFSPSTNITHENLLKSGTKYGFPNRLIPSFVKNTENLYNNNYQNSILMKDILTTPSVFITINESSGTNFQEKTIEIN